MSGENRMTPLERWYAYGNANGDGPWNDPLDEEDEDERAALYPPIESEEFYDQRPAATCYNCDAPLSWKHARHGALFCGQRCRDTAKAIRYARAAIADGRYKRDPLVREAIDTRIALILGGGYPENDRRLSREVREAIFARDDWRCCICGAPATEIDHIAGSSPAPENLRALCGPCHRAKTQAGFRPATVDEAAEADAIWARIRAKQPLRPCDDEKHW